MTVEFELDGEAVTARDDRASLLDVLRDECGVTSVKDGCSPLGQCGCCTVLIDGSPRVACVTPVARVRGRAVTTVDGIDAVDDWAAAFCATGASQCGFCTPGIIVRLAALDPAARADRAAVDKALLAHLCRCTGWQTIREASASMGAGVDRAPRSTASFAAGERRARLEGAVAQSVGPSVALGRGGFADDGAPDGALVAGLDDQGDWIVARSMAELRRRSGVTQGRRTTAPPDWPIEPPPGEWDVVLQTTWVEPAYLEPDAAWCAPGGEPVSPLGNGGAFGGKLHSEVGAVARRLADEHGRPVRVLMSREATVRLGPKRPPLALGVDAAGAGVVRLARPGDGGDEDSLRRCIAAVAPQFDIEFVDVVGPSVSASLRAAGWAEVAAAVALATGDDRVVSPEGASATASFVDEASAPGSAVGGGGGPASRERLRVTVACGEPLDGTVLRSYAIGAAHMALGMVRSEAISLDAEGRPLDLTIRSFGVLRAVDTPHIDVVVEASDLPEPVNGSDAVFAAVLAAAWRRAGTPGRLPTLSA